MTDMDSWLSISLYDTLSSRARCHFWASSLFIHDLFPEDLLLSFVLVGKLVLDQYYLLTLYALLHPILAPGGQWLLPGAAQLPAWPVHLLKESLTCRSAAACWCQHSISASLLAMLVTGQRSVLFTVTALHPGPLAIFVILHFPGITKSYSISSLFFREVEVQKCTHRLAARSRQQDDACDSQSIAVPTQQCWLPVGTRRVLVRGFLQS